MRAKSAGIKRVDGDVKYNSLEVAKIINRAMIDGKKVVAEKQVYKAMDIIDEKTGQKTELTVTKHRRPSRAAKTSAVLRTGDGK